jgi:hypothetical protein
MYAEGLGVEEDDREAVNWFQEAADQGYIRAQYRLGRHYQKGRGVPRDSGMACKWFQKAAEQGYRGAQYRLGSAYAAGDGVKRDDVRAYAWLYAAALGGGVRELKARNRLREKLTAAQLIEGERLGQMFAREYGGLDVDD